MCGGGGGGAHTEGLINGIEKAREISYTTVVLIIKIRFAFTGSCRGVYRGGYNWIYFLFTGKWAYNWGGGGGGS